MIINKINILSVRNRYIPALLIIAIFTLFAYITLKEIMGSIKNDGELINKSGRQRMFSQNIVLLSKNYLDTKDNSYKKLIEKSASNMRDSHTFLLQELHTQKLKDIYYKDNLDEEVNSFLHIVDKFLKVQNKKSLNKMRQKALLLLEKLDIVVFEYENIYRHKLENLEAKEDFIFILTLIVLMLEAIIIFYPASKKIKINEKLFQARLNKKTKELEELNKNLQKRVSQELEKNREKDNMLNKQAKIIEMNEMLVNIAHQWRQPLSFISTAASGLKVQKEMDILEDSFYYETLDEITNTTQELSKTIDTLGGLIIKDKDSSKFSVQQLTDETIKLFAPTFKEFHIEVVKDFEKEPIEINSISSLITQVILNILDNSKDAFIENSVKVPIIIVCIKKSSFGVKISIEDNAGGIKESLISKIFDPYFTTKHQTQGKGTSLHYCYNIVTQELNGKIYLEKVNSGTKFSIELPFKVSQNC